MRLWETPVPIPNTMVKTQAADDTMLETAWESRWVPVSFLLFFNTHLSIQELNTQAVIKTRPIVP